MQQETKLSSFHRQCLSSICDVTWGTRSETRSFFSTPVHGRRKDFFQGEANSGFSRGSQKDFTGGGKSGQILL